MYPLPAIDRALNGSVGMKVNRMLDALGLPDKLGDLIGARIDLARGDVRGAMRNLADATSGLATSQMDLLYGKGLPPRGFVPRPHAFVGLPQLGVTSPFSSPRAFFGYSAFGGCSRETPFGRGLVGRSAEAMCRINPFFKAALERRLGGHIIPDSRNDGRLTVYRPPFGHVGGLMRSAFASGLLPQVGIAASLAGVGVPLAGALGGSAVAGGVLRGLMRMEANMTGFAGRMTQVHNELLVDPQAHTMAQGMGIDLRTASFEDLLFLLLMKYAKKKEQDIMKKVQQLDKSMQKKKKGKGGLGLLKTLLPGLGHLIAGAVEGAKSAGRGGASGMGGGNLGESMDPSKMSDTMKQQMLQKLMGDLQKLYEMLSNMIKSMHDMQMTPTRNLRG
jgi:hypothetical protein